MTVPDTRVVTITRILLVLALSSRSQRDVCTGWHIWLLTSTEWTSP